MKTVRIDKLEPGMILAQKIERPNGQLLARPGTELSSALIAILERMVELEAVAIEGTEFESPEAAFAWRDEELRKLMRRFSKVANDPVMAKLKMIEAKRIVKTIEGIE